MAIRLDQAVDLDSLWHLLPRNVHTLWGQRYAVVKVFGSYKWPQINFAEVLARVQDNVVLMVLGSWRGWCVHVDDDGDDDDDDDDAWLIHG